ncbi:hypothetical protein ThrDRAFT_02647 [Frankia casuarinae]|uniref:Major facilitator superfamily MFS_1 n=4 Tax=Frankiaceae TaxID=74712 RepID=Q2J913_FRACC|nr:MULTISPECIES: MFS transporter [Frankia]ABD12229.1 major facilitator superfamily MFS_1 [Frankia casuarinae]ETA02528.1 hypothetical protein CcI6DRAFT_02119 [Frankia sp. CcI6]EYT91759.1 hypothetical protein ThrDRAFT_02647 [Frankia casuarinae]KDA42355.1 hypothetical protein BMG523Draft_02745 [Frankia sp. BMG5.23]KFB04807.1 Major Facilitator Superfamily transporter [Frankia sp. Allo2]
MPDLVMQPMPGMRPTPGTRRAGRREWAGLAVLALPCLLLSIDVTVLYFALPFITARLAPSGAQLLWIVDIYSFVLAGLLITMGTVGDRIGRRRLLLYGAAVFGTASVLAAYATGPVMLILARAAMGAAGATLMPSTLGLIRVLFVDPDQRRVAVAIWTASFSGGVALGPLLGGFLLEHFWWGAVFLINVPVMLLLLVLGLAFLPEFRDPRPGRFDLTSAGLSLAAVLSAVYGMKRIAEHGWTAVPMTAFVVGVILGGLLVVRQRRVDQPLIDPRLFASRAVRTALAVNALALFALVGFSFFATQYLQLVAGLTPLVAGLWTMLPATAMIISVLAAPRLLRLLRLGGALGAGLVVTALGFGIASRLGVSGGLPVLLGAYAVLISGVGVVLTICTDVVLGNAPPERAGSASALSESAIEFGGALGVAVLGSIATAVYRNEVPTRAPSGLPTIAVDAARETLGGAVEVAHRLPGGLHPGGLGDMLLRVAQECYVDAMSVTALIAMTVMAVTAIAVVVVLRRDAAPSMPESSTVGSSTAGDAVAGRAESVGTEGSDRTVADSAAPGA